MPPSERTQAQAGGDQEDEILERKPSHPVTTTLLIVSAITLCIAIGITLTELERYVNKDTRDLLGLDKEHPITAVAWHEQTYGQNAENPEEDNLPKHKRKPAPAEEAPAEQPASSETPAEGTPASTTPEAPAEGGGS